jgi:hypothetical protein
MGDSKHQVLGQNPTAPNARTGGPLGSNGDAGDPETPAWFVGDTAGPVGFRDHGDPTSPMFERMNKAGADAKQLCDPQDIQPKGNLPDMTIAGGGKEIISDGLIIRGRDYFIEAVTADLAALKQTNAGRKLLLRIQASKKKVRIISTDGGNEMREFDRAGAYPADKIVSYRYKGEKCIHSFKGTGAGSDCEISYNNTITHSGEGDEKWRKHPPMIGLAHELVHAMLAAEGKWDAGHTNAVWNRELQAVGLGKFSKAEVSENAIRRELRLAVRTEYGRDDESDEEPVF